MATSCDGCAPSFARLSYQPLEVAAPVASIRHSSPSRIAPRVGSSDSPRLSASRSVCVFSRFRVAPHIATVLDELKPIAIPFRLMEPIGTGRGALAELGIWERINAGRTGQDI